MPAQVPNHGSPQVVAANGLRDDGRRLDRLGELHSWNPVRSGNVASSRTGRVRKPTRYRTILTRMAHSVIAGGMNELLLG